MNTLTVELGERSYPILIDEGLLKQADLFRPFLVSSTVIVVTNDTVSPLYLKALLAALGDITPHVITVLDGEQYKTLSTIESIISSMLEIRASRDATVIALGGGVIGDMAGFAAACFQRGVNFIQVPTTLLSQVDSSVGGKTGVNHALGKNMIGAFYQPQAVVIDTNTLNTLPAREFSAGMAEVIKYGIIYDAHFFSWLEEYREQLIAKDPPTLKAAIFRCCQIKAEIVAQDEKEGGVRALLNLGHTFGHAIEAEQGYGNWLHGEAVSAGMVLAARLAEQKSWLNASEYRRICELLSAFDLPVNGPATMSFDDYIPHMSRDKKVAAGKIRFILPKEIGRAVVTADVSNDELKAILN